MDQFLPESDLDPPAILLLDRSPPGVDWSIGVELGGGERESAASILGRL